MTARPRESRQPDDAAANRRGEHEPGPGTRPVGELLAELQGPDEGKRSAPAIVARGLGLRTGSGWVFRDVDLVAPAASVTALVGPAGSGRSALLLAITGRMRITEGTIVVAGDDGRAAARRSRSRTAIARIADLIVPEERLTVEESVTERCLIDAVRPARGRSAFRQACVQMSVSFDGAVLVEHLSALEQAVLALALAAVRPADVIVLDDTDAGVTDAGEREIYRAASALATSGVAIITSTTRRDVLPAGALVTVMGEPESAGIPVTAKETT